MCPRVRQGGSLQICWLRTRLLFFVLKVLSDLKALLHARDAAFRSAGFFFFLFCQVLSDFENVNVDDPESVCVCPRARQRGGVQVCWLRTVLLFLFVFIVLSNFDKFNVDDKPRVCINPGFASTLIPHRESGGF